MVFRGPHALRVLRMFLSMRARVLAAEVAGLVLTRGRVPRGYGLSVRVGRRGWNTEREALVNRDIFPEGLNFSVSD